MKGDTYSTSRYLRHSAAAILLGALLLALGAALMALLLAQSDELKSYLLKADRHQSESCDAMIEDLPVTITHPGVYCLARSIDNSKAELDAITIDANDVVISGQGRSITGPSGVDTKTRGILAIDRHGLTVRNIRIEGFATAILIGDTTKQVEATTTFPSDRKARDILIEGVRVDDATFQGIHVRGDNFTIRESTVSGIGPSTTTPHSFATGIFTRGNSCRISGNRVSLGDAMGSGENVGIAVYLGSGCVINDNSVFFDKYPTWGRNFGIWTKAEGGALPKVMHNLVAGAHYAYGPNGIFVENISENAACQLFARRPSELDLLADVDANVNYNTAGTVRPGLHECPDNPKAAEFRFHAAPSQETAYAVALAYAETSPVEHEVETLAWLLIAAKFGHPLAEPVSENPASSGYRDGVIEKARMLAERISPGASSPDVPVPITGGAADRK